MKILDYRPAPPRQSGCGSLFLQAIGGFMLGAMSLIGSVPSSSLFPAGTPYIVVFLCFLVPGLALTILLAFTRRPGGLIGFLIAASMFALLATTYGRWI